MLPPLERFCVLSVCLNERFNGLPQFGRALGAEPAQGFARENAKPDFHLVEPTGRSRCEVKMDVRMLGQPGITFFVRAVIVQNDMQLQLLLCVTGYCNICACVCVKV